MLNSQNSRKRTLVSRFLLASCLATTCLSECSVSIAQEQLPAGSSPTLDESSESPATKAAGNLQPSTASPAILNLANAIASARATLNVAALPKPDAALTKLQTAIQNLNNHLASAGAQRQSDWQRFLRLNRLQAELANPSPDLAELTQIEKNSRQNYPGLDMPRVAEFRKALSSYIDAVRFGKDPDATIKGLDERLQLLDSALRERGSQMSELEISRDLGLLTTYLASANQAQSLQSLITSTRSQPSARVLVSSSFVQRNFGRPVSEANPVNEVILGTRLSGQSYLTGHVVPVLIPNSTNATIQLNLIGQFCSNNVGMNRGVRLLTSSNAGVSVCETIQLSQSGLVSLNDTSVDTTFRSQINSIQHNLKLVRKIATKKAAQQKPQADAIGQQRLETRIANQFHQQLLGQLAEASGRIAARPTPVLTRLGLTRPTRNSWSSSDYLGLEWFSRELSQLSAPNACPLPVSGDGITAQVHQSMITNYLDTVLAGRVIRSQDLDDYAVQFGSDIGGELADEAKGEPWSLTLANYHPVEVEFENNKVSFQIRTVRLDRGDQALAQPATIRATYRMEVSDGYIQLYREGDVDIQFAGRAQRGIRAATLRGFLKSKFDKAFKETLFKEPVRPTDRLPAEAPNVKVAAMETASGWLQAVIR